jgi:hypothetical protein
MRTSGYRLADEPRPSGLSHIAVNPFWPFLSVMFGGAWLSWPWFVVNGFAVGSPTRRKELGVAIGGFVVTALLVLAIFGLAGTGRIPQRGVPYALLSLTVVKLGVTYWLHALQSTTFEVYEYYGGVVRQGFLVILAAYAVMQSAGAKLLAAAPLLFVWLR